MGSSKRARSIRGRPAGSAAAVATPGAAGSPIRSASRSSPPLVERPHALAGEASGELEGTGRWSLLEDDGNTVVIYDWRVRTTKRWMNLASPVARPIFKWNHDRVMRWGGEGLARHLGCRLLASS